MRKNIKITASDFIENEVEHMRAVLHDLYQDVGLALGGMKPRKASQHMREALPLIAGVAA